MPKRVYKKFKSVPDPTPEEPSPYIQGDLLDYLQHLEQMSPENLTELARIESKSTSTPKADAQPIWAELAAKTTPEQEPVQLIQPVKGRLYAGRTVTGGEYSGYFGFTTNGNLHCLCDSDSKPIALVVPASLQEIPE